MFGQVFPGLGKLGAWGQPLHGLVRGGEVHLPNGTTAPWLQPEGQNGSLHPDHRGYTFYQRLPGVPDIERTPEQLVEDALAGREWRADFLVCGTDYRQGVYNVDAMQIYGKKVGGWIYAAPDGSRWLVKNGCALFTWTQGSTITTSLRLDRFGSIGGSFAAYFLAPSLTTSAAGQSSPSVSGTARTAKVIDITHAGDRAIVMLMTSATNKTALGFLELTITGTPGVDLAATLTVLKTRAEALGTVTLSNAIALVGYAAWATFAESTDDQRGAAPDCGYVDTINTPTAFSHPAGVGEAAWAQVCTDENLAQIEGRVVAMWYDSEGIAQPVLLDVLQSYALDAPPPVVTAVDDVIWRVPWSDSGGTCVEGTGFHQQFTTLTRSYTHSSVLQMQISLTFGANTFTRQWQLDEVFEIEQVFVTDEDDTNGVPGESTTTSWSRHTEITTDGALVTEFDASGSSGYVMTPNVRTWTDPTTAASFTLPTVSVQATFLRWSNNLVGFWINGGGYVPDDYASPAMSPAGQQVSADPTVAGLFGSFNPATGAAIFPSADPVSWI
jgi:hypothetical protein